ncbi:MAG: hypothetical protein JWN16_2884 [Alphaproteobacteria bacterium]|nr:hypothetical protein [Alphaproteobacteria bacterium]
MNHILSHLQNQDIVSDFIADVFNATTIALVSVLGLLTIAATI